MESKSTSIESKLDAINWMEKIFVIPGDNDTYQCFYSCRNLGLDCSFEIVERYELDNMDAMIASIIDDVKRHIRNKHPHYTKGMHIIADDIRRDGYGVVRNFFDKDLCWELIDYIAASGKEEKVIKEGVRIAGETIQTTVMAEDIKKFFTKTEPYINSPKWKRIEPLFQSLECLGTMLVSNLKGRKEEVVFDQKLSFLTSKPGTGYQFPHFDEPYHDVIQMVLVISENVDPTLVIPNSMLKRGEPVYSTEDPSTEKDLKIKERVRCLAETRVDVLESQLQPMCKGKLQIGDLLAFTSDTLHAGPYNSSKTRSRRVLHMTFRVKTRSAHIVNKQTHIGEVAGILYDPDLHGDRTTYMVEKLTDYLKWNIQDFMLEKEVVEALKAKQQELEKEQQELEKKQKLKHHRARGLRPRT